MAASSSASYTSEAPDRAPRCPDGRELGPGGSSGERQLPYVVLGRGTAQAAADTAPEHEQPVPQRIVDDGGIDARRGRRPAGGDLSPRRRAGQWQGIGVVEIESGPRGAPIDDESIAHRVIHRGPVPP